MQRWRLYQQKSYLREERLELIKFIKNESFRSFCVYHSAILAFSSFLQSEGLQSFNLYGLAILRSIYIYKNSIIYSYIILVVQCDSHSPLAKGPTPKYAKSKKK